jgi:hypothetical protein
MGRALTKQQSNNKTILSKYRKAIQYAVTSSCAGPDRRRSSLVAGGSLHPHGKLYKVNIECGRDNRRGVVAAECLWAHALHYQHSHWQVVTGKDDAREQLEARTAEVCAMNEDRPDVEPAADLPVRNAIRLDGTAQSSSNLSTMARRN